MKESLFTIQKKPIFRETFTSEQDTMKNGGVPTAVTFFNGIGTFNGSSSYINYGNPANLQLGTSGTIRIRIKPSDGQPTSNAYLCSRYLTTGNERSYGLAIQTDGKLLFNSSINGTDVLSIVTTNSIFSNGQASSFIEVTFTWSGTTGLFYVNGSLVASTGSMAASFYKDISKFYIGAIETPANYYSGDMDLVEIYNYTLNNGQVESLYKNKQNDKMANPFLIQRMKELGYVWVPGNSIYSGCEKGFFVAKYQMKASKKGFLGKGELVSSYPLMTQTHNTWYYTEDSSITPVSSAEGSPITYISQTQSIALCSSIQANFRMIKGLENCSCHLITNNEWMTIARNIEQVTSNWSGAAIGSGYIYSGHNDNVPAAALAADTNNNNGYYLTGQTTGNQRRTLTLTNGEIIWDLSGNVWEWTNNTIQGKNQPDGYLNSTDAEYTGGFNWEDYSKASGGTYYLKSSNLGNTTLKYNDLFLLSSSSYTAAMNGIGRIYTYSNSADVDTTVYGFLRGGGWGHVTSAGLLALLLHYVPGYTYCDVGFRCVVVP